MYEVELTYFRYDSNVGKFYSNATYKTDKENLWEIWDKVEEMAETKSLPELVKGHSLYFVLVNVPKHPYNHPFLVVPFWYENNPL